MPKKIWEIN